MEMGMMFTRLNAEGLTFGEVKDAVYAASRNSLAADIEDARREISDVRAAWDAAGPEITFEADDGWLDWLKREMEIAQAGDLVLRPGIRSETARLLNTELSGPLHAAFDLVVAQSYR